MSRIDSNLPIQIGDATRPLQNFQDRRLQVEAAGARAVSQDAAPGTTIPSDDMRALAAQIKQVIDTNSSRRLSFQFDQNDKEPYLVISDSHTGEVVEQIPTKEIRELHLRWQEFVGMILDKKA